jgi:hypothetical protein
MRAILNLIFMILITLSLILMVLDLWIDWKYTGKIEATLLILIIYDVIIYYLCGYFKDDPKK